MVHASQDLAVCKRSLAISKIFEDDEGIILEIENNPTADETPNEQKGMSIFKEIIKMNIFYNQSLFQGMGLELSDE